MISETAKTKDFNQNGKLRVFGIRHPNAILRK